jgi:hypothetical protein
MNVPEQPPACSECGAPLRADSAPAPCSRWTRIPLPILVVEAGTAIALLEAAVRGDATLRSNGLHVSKLAYDDIGFTLLAVCILSCILASLSSTRSSREIVEPCRRLGFSGGRSARLAGRVRVRERLRASHPERSQYGVGQWAGDVVATHARGGLCGARVRCSTRETLNPRVVTV